MKIVEKIKAKQNNRMQNKPITIAFLGDSVTQGCFECYKTGATSIETVFDYNSAYSTRMRELLTLLYPSVQFNIINSGISGDSAEGGVGRLERDILSYSPDAVIVSFGLNDSTRGLGALNRYTDALDAIFTRLAEADCDVIFLTQNFMCSETSPHLTDELMINSARDFAAIQNGGVLAAYFDAARELAARHGVPVCDIYRVWKMMSAASVNTTELLANKLNHPVRELHYYTAIKLLELLLA